MLFNLSILWIEFAQVKVFISNNIRTAEYAENVECPVYIIGSDGDKVLSASLQEASTQFQNPKVKIFGDIAHEDYFSSDDVIDFINQA